MATPGYSDRLVDAEILVEDCNCRPSSEGFEKAIEDIEHQYVDVPPTCNCWENNSGTVVFLISAEEFEQLDRKDLLEYIPWFADVVATLHPDEFDYVWHSQGLLVRMWWD